MKLIQATMAIKGGRVGHPSTGGPPAFPSAGSQSGQVGNPFLSQVFLQVVKEIKQFIFRITFYFTWSRRLPLPTYSLWEVIAVGSPSGDEQDDTPPR